ncbi:prepilin-type N-terminal cleavage/methylation domain-containing protein [Motilimonas sp. E26]|uniref:prepilin-type N-terminal cleavage/methylation domain-containing protein n=1 Tax=Motilimonas sp. E26 TaxID=2865674 RepID=UPI001E475634|nr:prepilin-type N-terminal cleavage/methylation domain-containing protein [Motilimonas sp. E26]MCE0558534.1 prepilin-type N-terminal cleavage/methylation domain-containing protein [Motilimonas sp. E26]
MKQKGFTLIEVLVASVVLVALLSALLPLFNQSDLATNRAIQSNQRVSIERNIYNSLKFVNPYSTQQGNGELGDVTYSWRAQAITPEIPTRLDMLALDRNRPVRLYNISVEISPNDTKVAAWSFQFELLGWEV